MCGILLQSSRLEERSWVLVNTASGVIAVVNLNDYSFISICSALIEQNLMMRTSKALCALPVTNIDEIGKL
ncbi:hypothetical protein Tco_0014890 [Tanacetum coccineum]